MLVVGVDPGLASTGWAVVEGSGSRLRAVAFGTLRTSPRTPQAERLLALHDGLAAVLREHPVGGAAMEAWFVHPPSKAAMGMSAARGALLDFERAPRTYVDLNSVLSQLSALPAQTQQTVVAAALSSGWLERSLTGVLDGFFTWLASDDPPPPQVPIDLRPIKDRLQGPPGADIAALVVAAIPDCAPGQSPQLSFDRLPDCLPAGFDRDLVIDQVALALDNAAGALPDTADAGGLLFRGAAAASLVTVRSVLLPATSTGALFLLLVATLGIWLIGGFVGGRTRKGRLTWLGGWLLFAALIAAALALVTLIGGSRSSLLDDTITLPAPLTSVATEAVRGVAAHAVQQLSLRVLAMAAMALLAGAGFVIAGSADRVERNYRRA